MLRQNQIKGIVIIFLVYPIMLSLAVLRIAKKHHVDQGYEKKKERRFGIFERHYIIFASVRCYAKWSD